jgi:hypothetical protein
MKPRRPDSPTSKQLANQRRRSCKMSKRFASTPLPPSSVPTTFSYKIPTIHRRDCSALFFASRDTSFERCMWEDYVVQDAAPSSTSSSPPPQPPVRMRRFYCCMCTLGLPPAVDDTPLDLIEPPRTPLTLAELEAVVYHPVSLTDLVMLSRATRNTEEK